MTWPDSPLVSVIIPCFNLGVYLDEAVQSVLAQTQQDFEILIVDDGSTDEITRSVLASASWPRTTIFRTANRGLARARNFLVERARGQFLCALDADDKLHPQYFEMTLAAFDREPALTFVSSRLQMFGAEDRVWPPGLKCDLPTLLCEDPIFCAAMVRRAAVLDIHGYDEQMPAQGDEDWDFWMRLLEAGGRGVILPDVLFYYRRRPGGLGDLCTRTETHLRLFDYLVRKHLDSYRAHLPEVLAWKDGQIAEAERSNQRARGDVDQLVRLVQAGREFAAAPALQLQLEQSARELEAMQTEYERSRAEVAALRASASWKLTAPLRRGYDTARKALRFRPGSSPARAEVTETVLQVLSARERELLERWDEAKRLENCRRDLLAELERVRLGSGAAGEKPPLAAGSVDFGALRRTEPISNVWGLDRGMPLDRHYIEGFLDRHRQDVRGRVLEVKDPGYTRMFGGDRVSSIDVLDIDAANQHATIVADLTDAVAIADQSYDCVILTQVLGLIYDVPAALATVHRILKPGGVLLCTVPASGRISYEGSGIDGDYWRFTEASVRRLFAEVFPPDSFEVTGFGNVLAGAAFLYGLARHELSTAELDSTDPYFPVVYGVRAIRPLDANDHPAGGRLAPRRSVSPGVILCYHRICDGPASDLTVAPANFRAHLACLKTAGYAILPLADLSRAARSGDLPDHSVALTFDDGYADALTEVWPALRDSAVPATFFVVAGALEGISEFWWDLLDRIFLSDRALERTLRFELPSRFLEFDLLTDRERMAARARLAAELFQLSRADRDRAMHFLAAWSGVSAGTGDHVRPMTSRELVDLASHPGVEIGSHSSTHAWLPAERREDQVAEISGSKTRLEALLKQPVRSFSYPYGGHDQAVAELVRHAGYEQAVTTEERPVDSTSDGLLLPRYQVRNCSGGAFAEALRGLFDRAHILTS